ncbi:MAG: tRNA preQ1(34) S-adenosylmethionine ribosyltransferase-isomerase QueA [Candidatus Omnitrophota bacterium]
MMLKLSDFDYGLPKELIAQYPADKRDESRLLVLDRATGNISHRAFKDIIGYFREGDILVINNTKVVPSRLVGTKETGGKVEALILNNEGDLEKLSEYETLLKPARGCRIGAKLFFDNGNLKAEITRIENGRRFLKFDGKKDLLKLLDEKGQMPLPPYIKREDEVSDRDRYQTIYASKIGAVAAPTAGLHFTKEVLANLSEKGVSLEELTLHVGYGTFKPVKEEDIARHKMEEEFFEVREGLVNRLNKRAARSIVVGTTTCRALETVGNKKNINFVDGIYSGWTDKFIYPPYKFKNVDCLLTNFHLPKTTLLMLVSAFSGRELLFKAYKEAIKEKYRFYSYGDCMLII